MYGIVNDLTNQVNHMVGCTSDFVEDVKTTMEKRISQFKNWS